jgi:hypothetical protein
MTETQNAKPDDLEERTYDLARPVRGFVKRLPRTVCNSIIERVFVFFIGF